MWEFRSDANGGVMMLQTVKRLGVMKTIGALCAVMILQAAPAFAGNGNGNGNGNNDRDHDRGRHHNRCKDVDGKAVWTLIPSPNDPLGRVLGPATGDLKASVSAYLTSLVEKNQLFAAGPFLDGYGALIIYEADSPEAVEALMKADPFHAAGVFVRWTVRPWKLVFTNPNLMQPPV